jgi:hypothetical protein
MKTKATEKASAIFQRMALNPRLWLPVLLIGFVYVIGPELYRRAIGPSGAPIESGVSIQTPDDVLKLIASLRTQLDSATDALGAKNREFEIVKHDLEMARHPAPRSGPLSTASLSLTMGKGTPREIAADNVRWIAWDARTRGSELRWSTPSSTLGIYSLNPQTYPDLSPFTDGEYTFIKNGTSYRIFDLGSMSIIFMTFDKPVDTTSFQLSSESTLPKWKYWCKDNSVCAVWFDERPDNLSFTVRVGR